MKQGGFNLKKSGQREPERVARLLIAVALVYVWMVYLAALALEKDCNLLIHRTDRCDLSLFRLGLRLFGMPTGAAQAVSCVLFGVERKNGWITFFVGCKKCMVVKK